ncbi:MAG: glycosyltransferase family protein [Rhodospirillaceae bacterium]|nr:glycosyltransferase family protein [Rhodospirillaceae bacterium]
MTQRRVIASIEARMGSSRLPGKVLMDIHGQPALWRLVDRLRQCHTLDDIIVATSTAPGDDVLADWCANKGIACFRGSENDVLQRVVMAQKHMRSDIVVEITGDCPLTDPEIIDLGVETFLTNDVDVVCTVAGTATWPMGQDIQVYPLVLLDYVERTVHDLAVREHVSLHFYENPDRYRIHKMIAPRSWQRPNWRFQLDYAEDLAFLNAVYASLEPLHGPHFGMAHIMSFLHDHPEIVALNISCEEKPTR